MIFAFAKLLWVWCAAGERLGGVETKINTDQTKGIHPDPRSHSRTYTHTYSLTHTHHTTHRQNRPTALCLSCGTYRQEGECLSFLGSVNILNKNKFLLSEKAKNSHRRGSWTLTALPLKSFRESRIMKASYILILLIGEWM